MNIQAIQNIPCEIKAVNADICSVTFTLPVTQINAFVLLMSSLTVMLRGLGWKVKTNNDLIHAKIKKDEPETVKFHQEYEEKVLTTYNDYINKGNTPRESLSLTVSYVAKLYPFSSFDIVKNCLSKNKMLKKTGFYKSRHKFE